MRYITLLVMLAIAAACSKDNTTPAVVQDATYLGSFQRRMANGSGEIAPVAVSFSENYYSGVDGDNAGISGLYPFICSGNFSLVGTDSIHFNNGCYILLKDATLALDGRFKIQTSADGERLKITRKYGNLYEDIYLLTRKH